MSIAYYSANGGGTNAGAPFPISSTRSPTSTDLVGPDGSPFSIGQLWVNTVTKGNYSYSGGGVWVLVAANDGDVNTLSDGTIVVTPTGGNIEILGGANITTLGDNSAHSITVSLDNTITASGASADIDLSLNSKGTGNVTVDHGSLEVSSSVAGADLVVSVENTSTTAASRAGFEATVATTTGAADPFIEWTVTGSTPFIMGLDQSQTANWKLSHSTSIGTTDVIRIGNTGSADPGEDIVLFPRESVEVRRPQPAADLHLLVQNESGTGGSSATVKIVAGSVATPNTADDPTVNFSVAGSGHSYTMGIDNNVSDDFVITQGDTLGGASNILSVDVSSLITTFPHAITVTGGITAATSDIVATMGNITASAGNIAATQGSVTAGTTVTATLGAITATNGNLVLGTAGNKIVINDGSNASVGTSGAMSGTPGVVTVATTACSATAIVFYARETTGGTPGHVSITAQDGTGFTLTSTGNETSTFNWWIINL